MPGNLILVGSEMCAVCSVQCAVCSVCYLGTCLHIAISRHLKYVIMIMLMF